MWPDEELDSEKILKSIPEGFRAIDGDTGQPLKVGDKFIHLVLEANARNIKKFFAKTLSQL